MNTKLEPQKILSGDFLKKFERDQRGFKGRLRVSWIRVQVLPLTNCVTLGNLLNPLCCPVCKMKIITLHTHRTAPKNGRKITHGAWHSRGPQQTWVIFFSLLGA